MSSRKAGEAMVKQSAGFLMYRRCDGAVEVFLVHPGGPFWAKKDLGSWSIPKGEYDPGESPLEVAKREFEEETGFPAIGKFRPLASLKQPSGKVVHAWTFEGDCDATAIKSNTFSMEWPPRSGKQQEFPEVDRAEWFKIEIARDKILKGQVGFLEELQKTLGSEPATQSPVQGPHVASQRKETAKAAHAEERYEQQALFD
jgi:predicted NUDIX family NTP pyrophosphohydrolase